MAAASESTSPFDFQPEPVRCKDCGAMVPGGEAHHHVEKVTGFWGLLLGIEWEVKVTRCVACAKTAREVRRVKARQETHLFYLGGIAFVIGVGVILLVMYLSAQQ